MWVNNRSSCSVVGVDERRISGWSSDKATLLSPSGTIAENLSVLAWNDRPSVRPSFGRRRRRRRRGVVSPAGSRLYPFTHLQTQFVVAVSLSRLRRQNCFVPPMSERVTRDGRLGSARLGGPANKPAADADGMRTLAAVNDLTITQSIHSPRRIAAAVNAMSIFPRHFHVCKSPIHSAIPHPKFTCWTEQKSGGIKADKISDV